MCKLCDRLHLQLLWQRPPPQPHCRHPRGRGQRGRHLGRPLLRYWAGSQQRHLPSSTQGKFYSGNRSYGLFYSDVSKVMQFSQADDILRMIEFFRSSSYNTPLVVDNFSSTTAGPKLKRSDSLWVAFRWNFDVSWIVGSPFKIQCCVTCFMLFKMGALFRFDYK